MRSNTGLDLFKAILAGICFFSCPAGALLAQTGNVNMNDITGFLDSRHHWFDIKDQEHVIEPLKDQRDYPAGNFRDIANNILLYQQPNGGWPKNYDMMAILTEDQKKVLAGHKDSLNTTIDNCATYSQVEYLAKAYTLTGDVKYKSAAVRGIVYMLQAQYDNGGWPQFYPDVSGYRKYITFNDGAMIGVMTVMQHIVQGAPYYAFLDSDLKQKAANAYQKGIACILKCQIKEKGRLTAWCQQHDNIDFKPAPARTFELASKSSEESAAIVGFLMNIEHPDSKIIDAVNSAVAWLKEVAIKGIRVKTVPAPREVFEYHVATNDRVVVQDPSAAPVWTRFYELETDRPLFANRDSKAVYQLSDVARERRTGYAWYGYWPAKIIDIDYPKWAGKIKSAGSVQ